MYALVSYYLGANDYKQSTRAALEAIPPFDWEQRPASNQLFGCVWKTSLKQACSDCKSSSSNLRSKI